MQLTDAEIREILRRRKIEKIRRQRRRRRIALVCAVVIIAALIILARMLGNAGGTGGQKDDKKSSAGGAADRGIIFIDPGHGGMDSGSDDDHDRYEKDDTLRLSLAVRDELAAAGYKVEMSRTEDELVDRTRRGKMANECGAQLFISIHRNKADSGGRGVEGFIPRTDDAGSRLLGENLIHFLGRVGFAERTIRAGTLSSPAEDYEELAATTMPSVLIEIGFLSSAGDNALFDKNMDMNARAIAGAIDYTFMTLYEPERAEEYAAMLESAERTADRVTKATGKAVEGTSDLMHLDFEYPDDGSTGIDPEA